MSYLKASIMEADGQGLSDGVQHYFKDFLIQFLNDFIVFCWQGHVDIREIIA